MSTDQKLSDDELRRICRKHENEREFSHGATRAYEVLTDRALISRALLSRLDAKPKGSPLPVAKPAPAPKDDQGTPRTDAINARAPKWGDYYPIYKEMRKHAFKLERENAAVKLEQVQHNTIWGFYEERLPQFVQGPQTHELQELVSAKEVQGYVNRIDELAKEKLEFIEALQQLITAFEQRGIGCYGDAVVSAKAFIKRHTFYASEGEDPHEVKKDYNKDGPTS